MLRAMSPYLKSLWLQETTTIRVNHGSCNGPFRYSQDQLVLFFLIMGYIHHDLALTQNYTSLWESPLSAGILHWMLAANRVPFSQDPSHHQALSELAETFGTAQPPLSLIFPLLLPLLLTVFLRTCLSQNQLSGDPVSCWSVFIFAIYVLTQCLWVKLRIDTLPFQSRTSSALQEGGACFIPLHCNNTHFSFVPPLLPTRGVDSSPPPNGEGSKKFFFDIWINSKRKWVVCLCLNHPVFTWQSRHLPCLWPSTSGRPAHSSRTQCRHSQVVGALRLFATVFLKPHPY